MKKYKKYAFLIFLAMGCKSYINIKDNNKKYTIEHLDKQKFDDNKDKNEYKTVLKDGTEIKQISGGELEGKNIVIEETIKPNSSYTTHKIFFYDNGSLKETGRKFYNFPIENWVEYNENGVLIKEIDYEEPHKFSIKDLQKKIKKEFGIDIEEKNIGVSVSRSIDLPPQYNVRLPLFDNYSGSWSIILIDGITGDIISKTTGKRTK